jgi:hypothetical protein
VHLVDKEDGALVVQLAAFLGLVVLAITAASVVLPVPGGP